MFNKENIKLSSGKESDFKIECDDLTIKDWKCLAYLISKKMKFKAVFPVPRGGNKLAEQLEHYIIEDPRLPTLICDDVLTTGESMETMKELVGSNSIGVVVYARGKCPDWVTPIFQMWEV